VQAWWTALLTNAPRQPVVAAMQTTLANLARSDPPSNLSLIDATMKAPNRQVNSVSLPSKPTVEGAVTAYLSDPAEEKVFPKSRSLKSTINHQIVRKVFSLFYCIFLFLFPALHLCVI
jgi:hypothetical protein